MIYCTPMSGSYFLYGSILEKCGNLWKNSRFSGRIWPDWGNAAWADMAGLGSIGINKVMIIAKVDGCQLSLITINSFCKLTFCMDVGTPLSITFS